MTGGPNEQWAIANITSFRTQKEIDEFDSDSPDPQLPVEDGNE